MPDYVCIFLARSLRDFRYSVKCSFNRNTHKCFTIVLKFTRKHSQIFVISTYNFVCVCVSRQEEIESPLSSFIESILQLNTDLNFCAFICYACHFVSFFFLSFGTLCMNVCVFGLFSSSTKEKNVKEGAKSV